MITVADVEGFALSLPEAWLDHPWGQRAVKVRINEPRSQADALQVWEWVWRR